AERVVLDAGLAGRAFVETRSILEWARGANVPSYIVSASPQVVVEAAVRRLALPVARIFGMVTAMEAGRITPPVVEPAPYRGGKVEVLRAAAPGATILGAFGDSAADLPMLAVAHGKVAVSPEPALILGAREAP